MNKQRGSYINQFYHAHLLEGVCTLYMCLSCREKRQAIDLVHDDVQKELIKEVEAIRGCSGTATEDVRTDHRANQVRTLGNRGCSGYGRR